MAGTFKSNQALWLEDVHFPEFDKHKTLDGMSARIFNAECRYDIIFGRDVLRRLGMKIDFDDDIMEWRDAETNVPMRPLTEMLKMNANDDRDLSMQLFIDTYDDSTNDPCPCGVCDEDVHAVNENDDATPASEGYKSKTISASTYDKVDTDEIAANCEHLTPSQREELAKLLRKFDKLFDGQLKT